MEEFAAREDRGVQGIELSVSNGNQAMLNAISKAFPASACQRCMVNKLDNVLGYAATKQQEQLRPELKAVFYQKKQLILLFQEAMLAIPPLTLELANAVWPTEVGSENANILTGGGGSIGPKPLT